MCNPNQTQHNTNDTRILLHLLSKKGSTPLNETKPSLDAGEDLVREAKSLLGLAFPILLSNLILYVRALLSMLFLGRLGDSELAGGTLAIAFANISGYSILSGLSLGMEPLCSQAFGARRPDLLSLTLHRAILFLLSSSIPISILWINLPKIFIYLHQPVTVAAIAHTYILFSLPDLITNSFYHPIKIYLRAQGITRPLTWASLAGTILHVPANLLLASRGVVGVATAASLSNLFSLLFLLFYVRLADLYKTGPTRECLSGWGPLARLAGPSCISVCLEWWWYEIMIVLCGLLVDPTATVASMGILIQTTGLIYNFPSSLGFAVSTRIGNELGANRPGRARNTAKVGIGIAVGMGMVSACLAAGMRDRWGRMYTSQPKILELTAAALPILGLCEVGNSPQTVACGVVRGSARPTTAANVNLGAFYLVGTPVAIGLGFYGGFGFRGLWIGLLVAQIICAGLMLYVVGTTNWEQQANRALKLTSTAAAADGEAEEDLKEPLICVVVATAS